MIYVAVYAVLAALGMTVDRRSNPRFWLTLTFCFLLMFMGTRYYVGCDFYGYLIRFENIPPEMELRQILEFQEPLFQLLTASIKLLGLDYVWLNVFASLIILAGIFRFISVQTGSLLLLTLFFPIMIMQLGMSGLRQGIAVSMLLAASVEWVRGKRLASGAILLVGAQFHSSLYLFLPMIFLIGRKISTARLAMAVLLMLPVALFLMGGRLDIYVERYLVQSDSEFTASGAYVRYALIFMPIPFFILVRDRVRDNFPEYYELMKLFALVILIMAPLGALSTVALHRLNYYVMPFSLMIFVSTMYAMSKPWNERLAGLLPISAYGLYMLVWLSSSGHAQTCYLPYESYLFQ